MTAQTTTEPRTAGRSRGRGLNITLWVVQILLAAFFLVAAAVPKLMGEATAVEMFSVIGLGQWFRYFVGIVELAGAIGLVIPRLSGLAATGLVLTMIGAVITSLTVLDAGALTLTPALLGIVAALIAWGRWPQTKSLATIVRR
ncbi:MAG: DoxX family protein [Streptosporangiales bacterium]|nr:DoxX family protein [Streptosporangiales bacterium]